MRVDAGFPFRSPHALPNGQFYSCTLRWAPARGWDGLSDSQRPVDWPRDMLGDISFDRAREKALETTDYMRSMGPFEPHRLPQEDMEYTTLPLVTERLEGRFEDLPG